jgi:pimeloyl-ACP methyl ester carboxylesterase
MKRKNKPSPVPLPLRILPHIFPPLERWAPELAARLAFRLFFTPMRYNPPKKEVFSLQKSHPFTLQHQGKKVQCYQWGEGPVVVMLHGWSGRGGQFREFIEPFTQAGYKVVAIDAPGHGASEGKRLTILDVHGVLSLLHQQMGPFKGIIGHSFGGASSLYAMSLGLPECPLVMIGSPTIGRDIIDDFFRKIKGGPVATRIFEEKVVKKYGKPFDAYSACAVADKVQQVPLLLVHDVGDKEVNLSQPKALKKLLPAAQLHVTEGLGHYRILKDPHVVNICLQFVQGKFVKTPA